MFLINALIRLKSFFNIKKLLTYKLIIFCTDITDLL